MKIDLYVKGTPVAWKPPRATLKNGRIIVYTDPKVRKYQNTVAETLKKYIPTTIDWPVTLSVIAILPPPKRKHSKYPTTKPDTTNILKCIEDVIVKAGVLKDDRFVITSSCTKKYAKPNETPHIRIIIKDLGR